MCLCFKDSKNLQIIILFFYFVLCNGYKIWNPPSLHIIIYILNFFINKDLTIRKLHEQGKVIKFIFRKLSYLSKQWYQEAQPIKWWFLSSAKGRKWKRKNLNITVKLKYMQTVNTTSIMKTRHLLKKQIAFQLNSNKNHTCSHTSRPPEMGFYFNLSDHNKSSFQVGSVV